MQWASILKSFDAVVKMGNFQNTPDTIDAREQKPSLESHSSRRVKEKQEYVPEKSSWLKSVRPIVQSF